MFELLLLLIGVLTLTVLLIVGRSRRATGDPSSSVRSFNRALSAMEPGAGSAAGDADAADADEASDRPARDPKPS